MPTILGITLTTVCLLVTVTCTEGQVPGKVQHTDDPFQDDAFHEEAVVVKDKNDVVEDIRVYCNNDEIVLSLKVRGYLFNGMIYPKGLSKNSTCMTEYINKEGKIQYSLPLRSCNTMSTDVENGIEYFNTIIVQPHRKLVTNQGKGYHIRCKYQIKERTLNNDFVVGGLGTTPLSATAALPASTMKIFYGEPGEDQVAENVKIGDPLTLVVGIDDQEVYGMHVTECLVKDGLGWSDQALISKDGCPEDYEIMGEFEYNERKTAALVKFQAHKFPYTSSVYYQCNVKLCIKHAGGCDHVPPVCKNGENLVRKRRQVLDISDADYLLEERKETIQVYSGLYVDEAEDLEEDDFLDTTQPQIREYDPDRFCISQRSFAIGIAIAGIILIIVVIIAIFILVSKRRRKNLSTTGSSIYSGPYTNTAYSHSSLSRRS